MGRGAWKTVARARTPTTRRYAAKVKVRTAGAQSIRVLAPKSKRAKAGASRTRAFTGWRWLDLTKQETRNEGPVTVGPVTIAGKRHATAMTFSNSGTYFNINGACDTFKSGVGVKDGLDENASLLTIVATPAMGDDRETPVTAGAPVKTVRQSVSGMTMFAMGAGSGTVSTVDPLVHCTVNRLPSVADILD